MNSGEWKHFKFRDFVRQVWEIAIQNLNRRFGIVRPLGTEDLNKCGNFPNFCCSRLCLMAIFAPPFLMSEHTPPPRKEILPTGLQKSMQIWQKMPGIIHDALFYKHFLYLVKV